MARSSRSTRRKQRSADGFQAPAQAGAAQRARERRRQVKPVGQTKTQTGARREARTGARAFAGESWAELKKVEWPGQRQLISATVVVIIAVAVVGAYLFVADQAFKWFVQHVLLNA